MTDSKVEFLYLNEEDMLKAGVLDAGRCVDTMAEVVSLLSKGDCLMGGRGHNDHGIQLIFPKKSKWQVRNGMDPMDVMHKRGFQDLF